MPPDTGSAVQQLERALVDSLLARDRAAERNGAIVSTPPEVLHRILDMWPARHRIDASRADMFEALMLAELRALYPPRDLEWLAAELAQERDGRLRLSNLLALPAGVCATTFCRVRLVSAIAYARFGKREGLLDRPAVCSLMGFFGDSTQHVEPRDSLERAEFGAAVTVASQLLERLQRGGRHSDIVFVAATLRAAPHYGRFGQQLARAVSFIR